MAYRTEDQGTVASYILEFLTQEMHADICNVCQICFPGSIQSFEILSVSVQVGFWIYESTRLVRLLRLQSQLLIVVRDKKRLDSMEEAAVRSFMFLTVRFVLIRRSRRSGIHFTSGEHNLRNRR